MRYHSQNLSECSCGKSYGSKFWRGRAWLNNGHRREIHWEWYFLKFARGFSAYISFGNGDCDSGILAHICIPFLFSFYIGVEGVFKMKHPHKTGVAIHDTCFYIYPFVDEHEWSAKMPWWEKSICFHFPWDWNWHSTEILEHKANLPGLARTVFMECRGERRTSKLKANFLDHNKEKFERLESETYDYTYRLKNGKIQNRKATVFVDRMTWRMRWWPLFPFQKSRTCISVKFSDEVGEGTGSWKGGCTGCGYEMKLGETPLECLRRMESEREFKR